jgi:hypothetical protein
MWESEITADGGYYDETITGFYLADDPNILIAAGQQWSYVFEIDAELRTALDQSGRIRFWPYVDGFDLYTDNQISGFLRLEVMINPLSNTDDQLLRDIGFREGVGMNSRFSPWANAMTGTFLLSGQRVTAEGSWPYTNLDTAITGRVELPDEPVDATVLKLILTPVSATLDAAMVEVMLPVAITGAALAGTSFTLVTLGQMAAD